MITAIYKGNSMKDNSEKVTIQLSVNQEAYVMPSIELVIEYDDVTINREWTSDPILISIPAGKTYTVTVVAAISGFKSPESVQYRAKANQERTINLEYQATKVTVDVVASNENDMSAQELSIVNTMTDQVYYQGEAGLFESVFIPYDEEYRVSVNEDEEGNLVRPDDVILIANEPNSHIVMTYDDSPIRNIVHGTNWALQEDGTRKSPTVSHSGMSKNRIDFVTKENNYTLVINLKVSSEGNYDFALVGKLDNSSMTRTSNYTDRISGNPVTKQISVSVPTAGAHYIEIGYAKDGSSSVGSDCAWYNIIEN